MPRAVSILLRVSWTPPAAPRWHGPSLVLSHRAQRRGALACWTTQTGLHGHGHQPAAGSSGGLQHPQALCAPVRPGPLAPEEEAASAGAWRGLPEPAWAGTVLASSPVGARVRWECWHGLAGVSGTESSAPPATASPCVHRGLCARGLRPEHLPWVLKRRSDRQPEGPAPSLGPTSFARRGRGGGSRDPAHWCPGAAMTEPQAAQTHVPALPSAAGVQAGCPGRSPEAGLLGVQTAPSPCVLCVCLSISRGHQSDRVRATLASPFTLIP